jgi:glucosyl-dolichyl phosphate glucuronosyltransferase
VRRIAGPAHGRTDTTRREGSPTDVVDGHRAERAEAVAVVRGDPSPLTFSVVLCAYTLDRWADIERAVGSLRQQTRRPDEILLVSDHNPDLLARATAAFPDVRCVANAGARGLSDARNTGIRSARGDVVAFLDDDAAAAPDWAEHLLDAYRDRDVIGVGGWVRPAWRAPRPAWLPDEFLWVLGCSYTGLPRSRAPIRNPIGANMSFRRTLFDAVGGFDTGTGRVGGDAAGCEETEFSIRACQVTPGSRIVLEPAAVCDHAVPPDRLTRRYFRRRCAAEGRSKAVVSALSGPHAALSSESVYVRRTLPAGVLRGLRDAVTGDPGGAARAWTIVEGTTVTAVSYLLARRRVRARTAGRTPA